ncbi:hypothetical protein NDU88_001656 [Pleurodeles waltl]|uniref:Uncharacterized protein n=1 Tax=Pleurodeles waltl TaxID=8319 RepID=A0AAV7S9J4_PLEWA|nr:hypothetical protein NDU88_001656 [Pleurodeles waltl]
MMKACHWCGGPYPHQGTCPAQAKGCTSCTKLIHFAKLFWSMPSKKPQRPKSVKTMEELEAHEEKEDMDDDDDVEGAVDMDVVLWGGTSYPTRHREGDSEQTPFQIPTMVVTVAWETVEINEPGELAPADHNKQLVSGVVISMLCPHSVHASMWGCMLRARDTFTTMTRSPGFD